MLEVADIFREAGPIYRDRFASRMLPSHLEVMRAIEACRTEALGGHVSQCDRCDKLRYSYHSCGNRHCPKCHGKQTRNWLDKQSGRLLSCPYYLLTFTLPSELRPLARSHQKLVYTALMRAAASSLNKLAADPRYLGARPGMMAVLHTWTRAMLHHPHVHVLVTAGGLAQDGRWVEPKNPKFLVPARALSVIFRAKFRDALEEGSLLDEVPARVWYRSKKWVVHCKHAGNGHKVLEYLARYVYRIAIVNSRLERYQDGQVTFRYRDNKTGQTKRCTLTDQDFIARFLQHVLPRSFTKVRYYGLYSSACTDKLERVKLLLSPQPPAQLDQDHEPFDTPDASDEDDDRCPFCREGTMRVIATLERPACNKPRKRKPP